MSRRDRWRSCPATDAERLAPSVESENSRDDPPEAAEQDETQVFGGARLRPPREAKQGRLRQGQGCVTFETLFQSVVL